MKAIVLAGGKGARLAPYTTILPKPLMPIGDMPILEVMLHQMKNAGIQQAILTVGHLSELWVMDADGKNRRMLTRGLEGSGVDHPRWVRIAG